MFREMRRSLQALPLRECETILNGSTHGVLAVHGDGDYPYAVPVSYVYQNGRIYIHCARTGHKLDAIARCARVSFCVVGQDDVVPDIYSTDYRSVIVFGRARVLDNERDVRRALEALAARYAPDESAQSRQHEILSGMPAVSIIEITAEHITGKESKRLARERAK